MTDQYAPEGRRFPRTGFEIAPDCEGCWDTDTDLVIVHPKPNGGRHGAHVVIGEGHHELISRDPVTISPSIACECGWHVHIRDGQVMP